MKLFRIIFVNSMESEIEIRFPYPIELNDKLNYKMAFSFSTYNTIYNITNENNKFTINGKSMTLTPGAFEIKELSSQLEPLGLVLAPTGWSTK